MRKVLNRVTLFDSEDVVTAKACIFVGYPLQTADGRRDTVRADTSQAGVNSHSIIKRTLLQGCPQENDAYCFLCGTSSLNSERYLSDHSNIF